MTAADLASGKGHRDENFPVASALIAPQHREPILAFYRVARLADDIADHAHAAPGEKLARLKEIEDALTGVGVGCAEAVTLRRILAERGLGWEHMLDLLEAFRRDVTQRRYATWDELMDYCRYSAAPVGRFVLDVHGESRALWPQSDALCAALQLINHLQDCAKDHAALDRVYLPQDALEAAGATVEMLALPGGDPRLTLAVQALAARTAGLLGLSRPFAAGVRDLRLALEVGAIQRLAENLNARLRAHGPFGPDPHHSRIEALGYGLAGASRTFAQRLAARLSRAAGDNGAHG